MTTITEKITITLDELEKAIDLAFSEGEQSALQEAAKIVSNILQAVNRIPDNRLAVSGNEIAYHKQEIVTLLKATSELLESRVK